MLKEIVSSGYLKMPKLDKNKSVAMCDKPILDIYGDELRALAKRYKEKIIWGLSPYEQQEKENVVFYAHSYPIYLGGIRQLEHTFSIQEKHGIKLADDNLLRLTDCLAIATLVTQEKTYEMVCGVLAMDKHKRKSLDSAQIWISEKDTSMPEDILDWFCNHFITEGYSPVVVSRNKMYTDSSIIYCGVNYKGD